MHDLFRIGIKEIHMQTEVGCLTHFFRFSSDNAFSGGEYSKNILNKPEKRLISADCLVLGLRMLYEE